MSRVVLDASAVLVAAFEEKGSQRVLELLPDAVVSAVNVTEVVEKLIEAGLPPEKAWLVALNLSNQVIPYDAEQARIASGLRATTRQLGLSLGDRACLALATVLAAPVYTADQVWSRLDIGVEVRVLR